MKIIINGKEKSFKEGVTIKDILKELKIEDKVMATAVNMNIVKKEDWGKYKPKDNDEIEFLSFTGGG